MDSAILLKDNGIYEAISQGSWVVLSRCKEFSVVIQQNAYKSQQKEVSSECNMLKH